MRSSTILWFLNFETVNVKRFLLLSLILTRFANVNGKWSSTGNGFNPLEHANHQRHHHYHQHQHHQHRHRHHHHLNPTLTGSLVGPSDHHQLIPDEENGDTINRSVNSGINSLMTGRSDGVKPCVSCASLDEDEFIQLKLEAIKNQILSKLHLDAQPNVSSKLPSDKVLKTLLESKAIRLKQGDQSSPPSISSYRSSNIRSSSPSSSSSSSSTQSLSSQSHLGISQNSNNNSNQNNDIKTNLESSESNDDYYGTTSEIISFSEPGNKINGHALLEFTLPATNVEFLEVKSADLWVQMEPWDGTKSSKKPSENQKISLFIFAIRENLKQSHVKTSNITTSSSSSSSSDVYFDKIVMKKISASPGWKQIDITNEIQKWFISRASKLTLMVDCSGCEDRVKFILADSEDKRLESKSKASSNSKQISSSNSVEEHGKGWKSRYSSSHSSLSSSSSSSSSSSPARSQFRPYIIINTKPKGLKRMKRDFPTNCDPNFRHCCVQSLYVNFTLLGWSDWIVAPDGFYANYCVGDCNKPIKTPDIHAFYHTFIVEEYAKQTKQASVTPCCAPTRLEQLQMLYIVGGNWVKADLPNMMVRECGCS